MCVCFRKKTTEHDTFQVFKTESTVDIENYLKAYKDGVVTIRYACKYFKTINQRAFQKLKLNYQKFPFDKASDTK